MFSNEKIYGADAENEYAGEDLVGSDGRAVDWRTTELEHPMRAQTGEHIPAGMSAVSMVPKPQSKANFIRPNEVNNRCIDTKSPDNGR